MVPTSAVLIKRERTAEALVLGARPMITAAAPETCGQAMDVPLIVLACALDAAPADVTSVPGAIMFTHLPKLLKPDRLFLGVVEPTLMAAGALPGVKPQPSALELPDAVTTTMPDRVAALIALVAGPPEPRPPKLMLITAGLRPLRVTQPMAAKFQDT